MKIIEEFVESILREAYPLTYQFIYDQSTLLQYLDGKMKAVHGDSKSRRSLANIYAVYSILFFYKEDFCNAPDEYRKFDGYDYIKLFHFYRNLYGGNKLQNHALNSRVNGEFKNKFPNTTNELIVSNNGKYLIHIDYLYVDDIDISNICCKVIEKYIHLLKRKDNELSEVLEQLTNTSSYELKRNKLKTLLSVDAEARIFEIISFSILKNHYKNTKVYIGYSVENLRTEYLTLYKTGRTNANDGGIDFVMRPLGRSFQVTEVNEYSKYLLDIEKVMHFPVTFVVKTSSKKLEVLRDLEKYIEKKSNGMCVIEKRYHDAIEEIITINELQEWMCSLADLDIDNVIRDIDRYYKLEMNID